MAQTETPEFPTSGIHRYVVEYISSLPDLSGKVVLDIPCGDGRASYEFIKKGARIIALDLFPHFMTLPDVKAEFADLAEPLPLAGESVDYIICQEGIEHIPNQLKLLEEFNRVLKPGGSLLLTTPSDSHARARLARLFFETDIWRRMPPTEIDGVWFADDKSTKLYFGHLFLLGVQHLQSLLTFTGFEVRERIKTDIGNTSLITGLLLYPLFALFSLACYFTYRKENSHIPQAERRAILWRRVRLNLSPATLFRKHIFWVARKAHGLEEVVEGLKKMQRRG